MDHHYADINGIRLHYVSAGAKGPLILFVHGFPEFWYAWKAQLEDFSRDHQAVALDMRGYNLSDKPVDVKAYRAKHLVQDLRGLIDHLGGRPCVLVAHDWGGAVAWNFAVEYPEYLSRLVIINAPHPVLFSRALRASPEQAAASQYMVLLRSQKAERVLAENDYERLVRMLRSEGGAARDWLGDDDLELYREAWSRPGALSGGLNYYRASPLYPASPEDPHYQPPELDPAAFTVSVPTLVIWGERDRALRPVLLEGMNEVVRKLTVKRIPEGSHWVAHEYPELVNRYIREFISN
ncbi:MAG: alpha/beta hydrolase [Pseudomonadota bacterium]|jgi:pimeloyl-ACP methyl ester carboxylesterase